jgi:hypothetical protein
MNGGMLGRAAESLAAQQANSRPADRITQVT